MPNEQGKLFSITLPGEDQAGHIRTRKDDLPVEAEGLDPVDESDRPDAQAQKTTGRIGLEVSGMSPRQAGGILNARAALGILRNTTEARAAKRAAEEAVRDQKRIEELRELLRSA